MRPAPVRAALFIAANQNAETNAGLPVAFFAQLMEAEKFSGCELDEGKVVGREFVISRGDPPTFLLKNRSTRLCAR